MAQATLAQIRAGLQTRLQTITGLQTYAYLPTVPQAPCAFVGSPRELTYHAAMGGVAEYVFSVWVLTNESKPSNAAQAELDEYVQPSGSKSIKAALEGTGPQTLGGIVDDVVCDGLLGYAIYGGDQAAYFGAQFSVRVISSGS